MPREDVPYPTSAICSIRERIAELRDELDQLLKTVNGVAGDANHDIKLISDNAALGITNDAVQHEIHLDLDASQLPAALVDSVNGQIGTVVLDGDDLDGVTPGNSVNDDITALQGADVTLQGNINAEATTRANGDSSLATAINAALATIPGEVSSQIAADATIAQLVYEDGQNVKLTGPQTISGVKQVPLQTTGQYSAQIASSQKVKNELDAYVPMVRTSGTQVIINQKKFSVPNYGYSLALIDEGLDITNIGSQRVHTLPMLDRNNVSVANIRYIVQTNGSVLVQLEIRKTDGTYKYINLGDNS